VEPVSETYSVKGRTWRTKAVSQWLVMAKASATSTFLVAALLALSAVFPAVSHAIGRNTSGAVLLTGPNRAVS